jgi:CRISPR-associated protein Csx17
LREGRANVAGRPATNALEFAEAACSLGVDRGIERFVRYSLLKRRGDSYVALPTGTFPTGYRSEADRVREFQSFFDSYRDRGLPRGTEDLQRNVEAAIFNVLLRGGSERMRELMRALGSLLRRVATTSEARLPHGKLRARVWLDACGLETPEVRIAGALASVFTREVGPMADNLSRVDKRFAWIGSDVPDRMTSVLNRRLQQATALECDGNPVGAAYTTHPGDATLFIEGSTDDAVIEDLLFAFATLDWTGFDSESMHRGYRFSEVLPTYSALKHLFLAGEIKIGPEPKRLRADGRIISLLRAGKIADAASIAVHRLRVAGFRPLEVEYAGGVDARRLAAALLIPVWSGKVLASGIFREEERTTNESELA